MVPFSFSKRSHKIEKPQQTEYDLVRIHCIKEEVGKDNGDV